MFRYRNNKLLGSKRAFNWLTERNVTLRRVLSVELRPLKDIGKEGFDGFALGNLEVVCV